MAGSFLLEEIDPFSAETEFVVHEACNVAPWPGQAIEDARTDRIAHPRKHDRHRARELLDCHRPWCARGEDDIRRQREQFRRVGARGLGVALIPSIVDPRIAAFQ